MPWILKQDGKTQIGWKWSRNTLENYLIDPIVVAKSLKSRRPDDLAYRQALEEARDSLTYYTAARYTLSRCRESFKVFLENQWGRKYSLDGHKLPEVRTKQDCVNGIQAIVHEALAQRESFDFRAFFDEFLPSCSAAGERYSNFLVYFSGKDLLIAMESQLKGMGYESAKSFRKMIVKSISDSDDVWEWLDEWRELRNQVMNMP